MAVTVYAPGSVGRWCQPAACCYRSALPMCCASAGRTSLRLDRSLGLATGRVAAKVQECPRRPPNVALNW